MQAKIAHRLKQTFIGFFLLATSLATHAITIDFDDLEPIPFDDGCFCPHPMSDEYLAKGLLIDNGFLSGANGHNALVGLGGGLWLTFVGTLPTRITMNVSAAYDQATFFDMYDSSGNLLFSRRTDGWTGDDSSSTPYIDNQFIQLLSTTGIARMSITPTYNLRVGASIDNVSFETEVTEPSTLLLLTLGLCGWRLRQMRGFGQINE